MPAGSTYEPIATTTLGSTATSYTFTSIPSTYTDLVLVIAGTTNSADNVWLRFNSDTGTNYSYNAIYGTGSAAAAVRGTNDNKAFNGNIGTAQSNTISHIMNYSNSTTNKTVISRSNKPDQFVLAYVTLWRNTAAITSVEVGTNATFQIGCTFTLYGIAAA